jgi:hypothetical protein
MIMISFSRSRSSSLLPDGKGGSEVLAQVQDYLAEAGESVKSVIVKRPALALGAALAVGVVLGWLIKRR